MQNTAIKNKFGNAIYAGPFQGMLVPSEVHGKLLPIELIGMYESALHKPIGEMVNRDVQDIVMVGGSNGYYPAGLSYLFNPATLAVFEMREYLHEQRIKQWFVKNNLKPYKEFGEATEESFYSIKGNVDLLFIDAEGVEAELVNPSKFEWQKNSDMIIEMHTFFRDRLANTILENVKDTHTVEIIYDSFEEAAKVTAILGLIPETVNVELFPNNRWIGATKETSTPTHGMWFVLKAKSKN